MLQVFDKHNRGYIVASDLRAVLQCLGADDDLSEEEIEDMIKEVDVDGDGRIDFYGALGVGCQTSVLRFRGSNPNGDPTPEMNSSISQESREFVRALGEHGDDDDEDDREFDDA
uniref:EF-hand domain-containing protein n=1 Tax=Timema tahoe TaxID=61484 RepID=A0A7R9ISL7_9NEOP|nr:unnamed protein product [Timema tahoe]